LPIPAQLIVKQVKIFSDTELISTVQMAEEPLMLKIPASYYPTPRKFQIWL
jgi:hypothetical protein